MAKETIVIDFTINAKEALENITNAREALVGLREEQKALQKEIASGKATDDMKKRFGELTVEIRELTGVINVNNRELQNQIKANQAAEGSLASYRAQIQNLKKAYAELSEEERNGAKGKELVSKMDSLTNSAKAAEWQLQGVPKGLSKTVAAMSQVNFGAGRAAAGIAQMGKAFKALMANPYALLIGAIVTVLKKLVDSFKKNDAAMTTLKSSMAGLKAILSVVEKAFQAIVNVVSKVIGAVGDFAKKVVSWIPGMKDYVQAQEDIVLATDNLEDAEREYTVNSAKRQAEISELRNKSTESEKYTYQQRREFLEEALKLEKEDADEKRQIAEEKLRIAQEEALGEIGYTEMTEEAWAKLSDEQKNTLTELQASVINTTTEFNNATRRMTSQLNSFEKEEKRQREERAKAAKEAAKQRAKNEKDALRQLEDLTIEAMKSLQDKEIAQTKTTYNRQIEDLKEKLKTEKNLSKTAKEAINKSIILLEAQLQTELGEIDKKYTEERLNKTVELTQKYYQEILKNKPDDIEIQVSLSNMAFEAEINSLKKRNEEIQKLLETANDEEKIAYDNELKWNNLIIGQIEKNATIAETKIRTEGEMAVEAVKQANEELLHQIEDNRLLGVYYNNEVEKTRIFEEQARRRLQAAQDEVTKLKGYSEEQITSIYGTQEAYNNALLTATNNAILAQNQLDEAARNTNLALEDQQKEVLDSYAALADATNVLLGNFENLFNTLAEADDKYAGYAKAMALTQVLISSAVSIAYAIEGAVKASKDTGPLAAIMLAVNIVAMVGAVVGAIAQATNILKKTTKPSKPKFAEGGLVGDQVTERTDDTIDAKLSVGEFVVRSASVKSIGVQALNQINKTGMLPVSATSGQNAQFNMEAFKDIMVEAVADIHPVVSVKEITSTQNAVQIKENIAKY